MKRSLIIIAATLFSTAAFAEDPNQSSIRGKGPFSVERNHPGAVQTGYTRSQINAALAWTGQCCELGTGRVLYDANKRDHESTTTYIIDGATTTIHTQSK